MLQLMEVEEDREVIAKPNREEEQNGKRKAHAKSKMFLQQ